MKYPIIMTFVCLAGCGGASSFAANEAVLSSTPNFPDIEANMLALANQIQSIPIAQFDESQLSGIANYHGYLMIENQQHELLGNLSLSIRVQNSNFQISGDISSFIDNNNQTYDGSLSLINSQIYAGVEVNQERSLTATISGEIIATQGSSISALGSLEGDLRGAENDAFNGNVAILLFNELSSSAYLGTFAIAR